MKHIQLLPIGYTLNIILYVYIYVLPILFQLQFYILSHCAKNCKV